MKIKRALISVWDKDSIIDLARFLRSEKIEIISTGGTKRVLEEAGFSITSISTLTGITSLMDGRVKTLHPKVFGGILADRNNQKHMRDLEELMGLEIDLVVINFYPFVKEAVNKKMKFSQAIEFIDIGGPSMIRAAAKNYQSVIPLCSSKQYSGFIECYKNYGGDFPQEIRQEYAAKVFSLTSDYEKEISNYLSGFNNLKTVKKMQKKINLNLKQDAELRYGENPHQKAGFYVEDKSNLNWFQIQGKQLSYNNYSDMESAFKISSEFSRPSCTIIKHSNPCGFGLGVDSKEAYERAVSTDPVSYFGGIVGFNKEVDSELAKILVKPFLECIIAPSFSEGAKQIFTKKKNLRIITIDDASNSDNFSIRSVLGGYLYQEKDDYIDVFNNLKIVTKRKPNNIELESMKLGWKLVRHVKSNAIVLANEYQLLGVGAGQMSRIDSVKIAVQKVNDTNLNLAGSIMASDAFFPFSDSLHIASDAGIKVIIQPGGSIKDDEVIEEANNLGLVMAFTGIRHFLH